MLDEKMKMIVSVGAEFEGGICYEELTRLERNLERLGFDRSRYSRDYDTSVNVEHGYDCDWIYDIEIRYWSYSADELARFAKYLFDNTFKQNETCGNHMHFRFRMHDLAVSYIMQLDNVSRYIIEYKNRFGAHRKYAARLRNNYSKAISGLHDLFSNIYYRDRYFALNAVSYFESQNTFEVRIMPYAKDYREWVEMLEFNIETLEKILEPLRTKMYADMSIDMQEVVSEVLALPSHDGGVYREVYEIDIG